ncbi:hypothetical protein MHD_07935 [Mannheimia granulomatis]|uniref:Uncharacterized protein n=1 Tax=Mannheimia granulomatis TaxID=85402 RepID=A0A011MJI2_9PAST|nr:hypothetical protein [Mannheimia granulomatis]EXI62651.1 hypothetical protein AK33_04455 [Mannheimia granulomatis]RGE47880.1 hypothetical protein MHD_07935 [Mannheimia granulomatis]
MAILAQPSAEEKLNILILAAKKCDFTDHIIPSLLKREDISLI